MFGGAALKLLRPSKEVKRIQDARSPPGTVALTGEERSAMQATEDANNVPSRRRVRTHGKRWTIPASALESDSVAGYLEKFGFAAADASTWEDLPQDEVSEGVSRSGLWVSFGIAEHVERKGHTWYQVECSLAPQHSGAQTVQWQAWRRLQHIRDIWHRPVKSQLGEQYKQFFDDVPFAHRGGRRGTSARLHEWCERLSTCINAGQVEPGVVALTLRFLEAPDPTSFICDATPSSAASCCGSEQAGSIAASVSTCCESTSPRDIEEEYESDFESESESGDDA